MRSDSQAGHHLALHIPEFLQKHGTLVNYILSLIDNSLSVQGPDPQLMVFAFYVLTADFLVPQ
jgi:hypothetical protein